MSSGTLGTFEPRVLTRGDFGEETAAKMQNANPIRDLSLSDPDTVSDELLPEYRFDYSRARPNRFAPRPAPTKTAIDLDPDVAAVFTTPEAVNAVLRALIQTMPQSKRAEVQ